VDGFKKRTPFQSVVSAHADYSLHLGGQRRLVLLADVFNLFDQKTVLGYDTWVESGYTTPNPNYGYPSTSVLGGNPAQFQIPRQVRVGARFEF
jgi:hypothetical protein